MTLGIPERRWEIQLVGYPRAEPLELSSEDVAVGVRTYGVAIETRPTKDSTEQLNRIIPWSQIVEYRAYLVTA